MQLSKRTYVPYYLLALLPPLGLIAGGIAFHSFVTHAILTNLVLNGIILGTAAVGAVLMLLRIQDVVREWKAFHAFDAAAEHKAMAEGGAWDRVLAGRLLRHLAGLEGAPITSRLQQAHIQEELDELHKVMEGRQELAQYLVGLMIALGLLGTFIGLLETLVAVGQLIGGFATTGGGSLDESFTKLIGNLERPLSAMGTAFSASMFGLIGSLVLGLMLIVVRASQARFMQYARDVVNRAAEHLTMTASTETPDAVWITQSLDDLVRSQQESNLAVREQVRLAHANELRQQATLNALDILLAAVRTREDVLGELGARLPQLLSAVESAAAAAHGGSDLQVAELRRMAGHLDRWSTDLPQSLALATRQISDRVADLQLEQARLMDGTLRDAMSQRLAVLEQEREFARTAAADAMAQRDVLAALAQKIGGMDEGVSSRLVGLGQRMVEQGAQVREAMEEIARARQELQRLSRQIELEEARPPAGADPAALRELSLLGERLQRELRVGLQAVAGNAKPGDTGAPNPGLHA